jgi:hypothetical protein
MIKETIVTTLNDEGVVHIAPMGIHILENGYQVMPFRPSTTLNNMLQQKTAVINYVDDVRIFAGCLTGRRHWKTQPATRIEGRYLDKALAHTEIRLERIEDDETRPKLFCSAVHTFNHKPFTGFNRAQYSVLEAAILVSRLHMLPWDKIQTELDYLRIGLDKTAGPIELEAWGWLMQAIDSYQQKQGRQK